MNQKYKLVVLLCSCLGLSSCKTMVKTDDTDIKVKGGGYEIQVQDKSHPGDFCPPGQAKKGNC